MLSASVALYVPICVATILLTNRVIHWVPLPFPLYILSGILLGPYGLGIAEPGILEHAGHYGLILMLFAAGLKVDVKRFASMSHIALWMLVLQVMSALALCAALRAVFGFDGYTMLLWTFVCVLSSTVCALQIMESDGALYSPHAISVLVIQDMALPIMLLVLKARNNLADIAILKEMTTTLISGIIPLALVLGAGYFVERQEKLPVYDRWYYILLIVTWCLGSAALFEHYELSCEYGAFLAGLAFGLIWDVKATSNIMSTAVQALSAIFFVFIGAKSNIPFITDHGPMVFGVVVGMFCFKSIINTVGLNIAVHDNRNLRSGVLLSTLSELSFSLLAGNQGNNMHAQLIESSVMLCILLSTVWYNMLIGSRRIW